MASAERSFCWIENGRRLRSASRDKHRTKNHSRKTRRFLNCQALNTQKHPTHPTFLNSSNKNMSRTYNGHNMDKSCADLRHQFEDTQLRRSRLVHGCRSHSSKIARDSCKTAGAWDIGTKKVPHKKSRFMQAWKWKTCKRYRKEHLTHL